MIPVDCPVCCSVFCVDSLLGVIVRQVVGYGESVDAFDCDGFMRPGFRWPHIRVMYYVVVNRYSGGRVS